MKVSIITICLNAELTIEQTIKSVINQTYKDIEYIIIDGKSSDHTIDIVTRYKDRISKVISEKDNGIYDAMNKGIKNATGDIIGILNSDDWYENSAVERAVEVFEKSDSQIVHGDVRFVWGDKKSEDTVTDSMNKLWYEMVVRHPATFVRREVYQRLGAFDDTFKIAGDYEFILRCYANNVKFYYLDKILTNFRMTGISNQQDDVCFNETYVAALRYVEHSPNKEENYKIIYGRMNRKKFSHLFREEQESVQFGDNLAKLFFKKKVYIWGCGEWGKRLSFFLRKKGIDVLAFCDSDDKKIGNRVNGIEIKELSCLESCQYPVLIAIAKNDEKIEKYILQMQQKGVDIILFQNLMECVLKDNHCYLEYTNE